MSEKFAFFFICKFYSKYEKVPNYAYKNYFAYQYKMHLVVINRENHACVNHGIINRFSFICLKRGIPFNLQKCWYERQCSSDLSCEKNDIFFFQLYSKYEKISICTQQIFFFPFFQILLEIWESWNLCIEKFFTGNITCICWL